MRYAVVAGLFVLSLITYIDRAAISSAKDALAATLHLSDSQIGAVFSAFALGYALAQIPAGWLADRFGPRRLLTLAVLLWSLLTALTGLTRDLSILLAVRFLFGVAEAAAFPASARAFYNWLPPTAHGRANGVLFAGSRLGAALAFPLFAWLLHVTHWSNAFLWLALPGIVWALAWFLLFRDHPAAPPTTTVTRQTPSTPLAPILTSRPILLAMSQYFIVNFTTFLCLSWMLPYLKQRYALSNTDAAFYAMIPLLIGATAQAATGAFVDFLYRSHRRHWSRRLPAISGFLLSATGLALLPFAPDAPTAALCFTIAAFGAEMTISPSWAYCMDIGGPHAGAVSGAMNMLGNFGSFVSANLFPLLQSATGSASAYFFLVMCLNLYSAAAWFFMTPPAPPTSATTSPSKP